MIQALPSGRASPVWRISLAVVLAVVLAGPAAAQGVVVCDAKIKRIAQSLRDKAGELTPEEAERGREALYAAIRNCKPVRSSGSPRRAEAPAADADTRRRVEQGIGLDRQSLRAQQNVLTLPELREGERRLEAIERKAQTDPYAAREMQKIYEVDRSLSTINRPIPGSPTDSPRMVGPGDRR